MLVIIPLIFSAVMTRAFLEDGFSLRAAILRAAVLSGAVIAVSTEVLSAAWALTPGGIGMMWILATGAASYYYFRVRSATPPSSQKRQYQWRGIYLIYLVPALILVGIVTANALLDPNHIADVLLYHLPRVQFWLQNQTVAFYPAPFAPQLYMPPWAEYAGAHYMSLTGTERGLGLVQTASMALCPLAVSGIVELLGFDMPAQVLGAAFALTIPQGAMQAYDLDNDYVSAFWMAAAVYFLLSTISSNRISDSVFTGAAIGLAFLTKGTSFLYITPFIAVFGVKLMRQPLRFQVKMMAAAALSIVFLNAPHWTRNYRAFGSPLGCDSANCGGSFRFRNDAIDPRTTVENIARNIGLHLGTEIPALNAKIEGALIGMIHAAGGDPSDPRSTWELGDPSDPRSTGKTTQFAIIPPRFNPDELGNPWHLMLIAVAFGMLPFRRNRKAGGVLLYAACVATGALLFCMVLRWQPWHTRLHLPLFVLSAPVVVAAFSDRLHTQRILGAICLALFAPVILDTYDYQLRPLVPFTSFLRWEKPEGVYSIPGSIGARKIRDWSGCNRVGLDTAGVSVMEGRLLSILGVGTGGAHVGHINMGGAHFRHIIMGGQEDLGQYCAILCVACESKPDRAALYRAGGFRQAEEQGAVLFYRSDVKPAAEN
jgi:hypothetical protein